MFKGAPSRSPIHPLRRDQLGFDWVPFFLPQAFFVLLPFCFGTAVLGFLRRRRERDFPLSSRLFPPLQSLPPPRFPVPLIDSDCFFLFFLGLGFFFF